MIIDNAGTYTLRYTATDDCGKTTTVDRELVVTEPTFGILTKHIFGTDGYTTERIGNAASLSDPVPQYSDGNGGWIGGSSPFDDIYPWSDIEVVEDATVGTLVKIPKYWFKWTNMEYDSQSDYELKLEISPSPKDGFHVSPAHADRGDGVGERDFVYVGRYHCASDYTSKTGVTPQDNVSLTNARGWIHNKGNDIWNYDYAMYWTIAMLYLVEFADWNSQAMIGGGCSDTTSSMDVNGLTDGMTYHTGTTSTRIASDAYGHIQYRHIEDLWSNVRDVCDGIFFAMNGNVRTDVFCIKNPSDFGDDSKGVKVGVRSSSDNYPTHFTNTDDIDGFEYAMYPIGGVGGASSLTHDNVGYYIDGHALYVGSAYYTHSEASGLFDFYAKRADNYAQTAIGCRLMKLPSA